jgi:serine/threonine protein kinase
MSAPPAPSTSNSGTESPETTAQQDHSDTIIVILIGIVVVLVVAVVTAVGAVLFYRRRSRHTAELDGSRVSASDRTREIRYVVADETEMPIDTGASQLQQQQPAVVTNVIVQQPAAATTASVPEAPETGTVVIVDTLPASRNENFNDAPAPLELDDSVDLKSRGLSDGPGAVLAPAVTGDFVRNSSPRRARISRKRHNERCDAVAAGAYQKGKILGRGAFGAVYNVMLKDGSAIAMKEMILKGCGNEIEKQMADAEREMHLLSTLRHQHIVAYYGAMADTQSMTVKIFMELVTGGSLGDLVREMVEPLKQETAVGFLRKIIDGLAFIHDRGILHRDIKADNVLIDPLVGNVKLADFGTARSVANATQTARAARTMVGTPLFMAPEVMGPAVADKAGEDENFGYGKKADVWSLGIMTAELLNRGKMPWPNFVGVGHAFMHITSPDGNPIIAEGISDAAGRFIRRCTTRDPQLRPSAAELLFDPFLRPPDCVTSGVVVSRSFLRGDTATDDEAAALATHARCCTAVAAGAYQQGKMVGRGGYGAVYAVMLTDGATIAMKDMTLTGTREEVQAQTADVEREMEMLRELRHPNVVRYYGVRADSFSMSVKLFMELLTGGSLGDLVRNMDGPLAESTAAEFLCKIVDGIAFVHDSGVLHRDIKADNVLIDADSGNIKLADFGTAKSIGGASLSRAAKTIVGTPLYMAPEVIAPLVSDEEMPDDEVGYGKKADVWSLGILAAEVLNRGKMPWPDFEGAGDAFMHIAGPEGIPIVPEGVSDEAARFIRRCTARAPQDRPSAAELLFDTWLHPESAASDAP